ncbi:MAG TPA: CARDB domain-containing protein, partial [Methanomicrobiales archaeon]|nr:CARDB domain-containing protein [Methanomicrobiales archaeon]
SLLNSAYGGGSIPPELVNQALESGFSLDGAIDTTPDDSTVSTLSTSTAYDLPSGTSVTPTPASATPEDAASLVSLMGVRMNPAVFFPYDEGTLTFNLTNGGTESVPIQRVTLLDKDIQLQSNPYDSPFSLGPGTTRTFTFHILAHAGEGFYYPRVYVDFRDAGSLSYPVMIQVDNTTPDLMVVQKPDSFSEGKRATVSVSVANPRTSALSNVILDASLPGAYIDPSHTFIGQLDGGSSTTVNFSLTPDQAGTLLLTLHYNNGFTAHQVQESLPVEFSTNKKSADLLISNVQITPEGGVYHISGDITNAGLEDANSVTVTSLQPAVPADPYKVYVVGSLAPDDFS